MNKNEGLDHHQRFKELAALERAETLTAAEQLALKSHLQVCAACRQVYDEYALISTDGMSFLGTVYGYNSDTELWDTNPTREKILANLREGGERRLAGSRAELLRNALTLLPRNVLAPSAAVLAACILFLVALGAYRMGARTVVARQQPAPAFSTHAQDIDFEKKLSDELIASQKLQLSRLQVQVSSAQQEVMRLKDALHAVEARSAALSTANTKGEEQLHLVSDQRDKLIVQLREAEQSYQLVQAELTSLRAEHDRTLLHTASLESKIDDLAASDRDQQRRLKDDEQYLASDRDIRELMGARQLYIADVFDVDSSSRTRKPFGRVFYTQNKSLIFYAFDLDHEPGVKNASAFQVWGQRDAESEKNHATNLGILYMDSDSNRRWVLRLDDPKQLAEIDAVFVTVEPHGGSQKPTGKPFLYALLRKEANHP